MIKILHGLFVPLVAVSLASVFSPLVRAQAPDASAEPRSGESDVTDASRGNRLIEEIIVTAQKREENLQEVPISVSAFSAEKLDALGIQSAQDLGRITPGMTITGTGGYSVVFLRGVGTDAFLPAADQSVPIYIDGINLVAAQNTLDTLGPIQRVEVLKGPQGTLFGRNATGGAISIVTADPESTRFFGNAKAEIGEYGERNGQVFVNMPLVEDRLAATISAFTNTRDSYYVNTGTGGIIDEYSRGVRGKLKWQALGTADLTLMYSYQQTSTGGSLQLENTLPAPRVNGISVIPADPGPDRSINQNLMSGSQTRSALAGAVLHWNLPWFDLKLIGSDQENRIPYSYWDFDGLQLPVLSMGSDNQFGKQKTAELQIISNEESPWSERFEWVAGIYYLKGAGGFPDLYLNIGSGALDSIGLDGLSQGLGGLLDIVGVPLDDGVTLISGGVLHSKSLSGYMQGTFNFDHDVYLTLGGRLQREERSLSQSRLDVQTTDGHVATVFNFDVDKQKATQISPRAVLKWAYADSGNLYLSWARGYKSPTINTVNFFSAPDAVKEEQIETYEIGLKSDWFGGGLRFNAALFHNRIKNLLTAGVALTSGGVVRFDNAGEAEIQGAEFDVTWMPMPDLNPGLAVTAAGTYLDSEYTDYKKGRGFDAYTGIAFGPDGPTPARDFTGNRVVRTPKYSYALALIQSIDIPNGRLELGIDTFYNDGFFVYPQNEDLYAVPSYQTIDARVSYFYDPWNIQFTIFGQNVSDKDYLTSVFVVDTGRYQTLGDPRVFGARIAWTF